jgi:hypothetical protein
MTMLPLSERARRQHQRQRALRQRQRGLRPLALQVLHVVRFVADQHIPVVGHGHVSLLTDLDTWQSKPFRYIGIYY